MIRRLIPFLTIVLTAGATVPFGLAAQDGSRGTLVVVNKSASTANIIDIESGRTLATLPTGEGPHEVVITGDGSRAVVTDYSGGNSLTVIDVPGMRVERTIDLAQYARPHGIAFLPGDELVAVTSEASDQVVIVNIVTGEIVKAIPTGHAGSHMLAVVAAGDRIFTSNIADATVSELDVASGRHTGTTGVPEQPEAIGVTPDGSEVWVGSNDEGSVSAIITASGEVEQVADGFGWPYRVLFTPDGVGVILPDLRGEEVRFLDRASRTELGRLSFPGGGPQGVTLSGDAGTLFLSLSRANEVVRIDLATMEVIDRIATGAGPDGVAYTSRVLTDG